MAAARSSLALLGEAIVPYIPAFIADSRWLMPKVLQRHWTFVDDLAKQIMGHTCEDDDEDKGAMRNLVLDDFSGDRVHDMGSQLSTVLIAGHETTVRSICSNIC